MNKKNIKILIVVALFFVVISTIVFFSNKIEKNNNVVQGTKYDDSYISLDKAITQEWETKGKYYRDSISSSYFENGEQGPSNIYKYNDDIIFYRGYVTSNNLIFDNMCFKIVRTSNMGIRVIYNGIASNNQCLATGTDTVIKLNRSYGKYEFYGFEYSTLINQKLSEWYSNKISSQTTYGFFNYNTSSFFRENHNYEIGSKTQSAGLLDVYEVIMAGAPANLNTTTNTNYFLIHNSTISKTMSRNNTYKILSDSVEEIKYYTNYNIGPEIDDNDSIGTYQQDGEIQYVTVYDYIRPVIEIPKNTYCATGSGTVYSPYILSVCKKTNVTFDTLNIQKSFTFDEDMPDTISDISLSNNEYYITFSYNVGAGTAAYRTGPFIAEFDGWYTEKNGQGEKIFDKNGKYVKNTAWKELSDITVYPAYNYTKVKFLPENIGIDGFKYPDGSGPELCTFTGKFTDGYETINFGDEIIVDSDIDGSVTCDYEKFYITFKNLHNNTENTHIYNANSIVRSVYDNSPADSSAADFENMLVVRYNTAVLEGTEPKWTTSKENYISGKFAGYCTQPNGEGKCVFDGNNLSLLENTPIKNQLNNNITLYAYYKATEEIALKANKTWSIDNSTNETNFYNVGDKYVYISSSEPKAINLYEQLEDVKISYYDGDELISKNTHNYANGNDLNEPILNSKNNMLTAIYHNYDGTTTIKEYEGIFEGFCTEPNGEGTCLFDGHGNWEGKHLVDYYITKDTNLYAYYSVKFEALDTPEVARYDSFWNLKNNGGGADYTNFTATYKTSTKLDTINLYEIRTKRSDDNYLFDSKGATTTVIEFINKFGKDITIYDKNDNKLKNTDLIHTGCTYELEDKTYTIIVKSDVDGDGNVTALDYVRIFKYRMDEIKLSGVYLTAADANGDNQVNMLDYVYIFKVIMNK